MKGIRDSSVDGGTEDEAMVSVSFTVPAWVIAGRQTPPEEFAAWARVAAAMFRYGRSEISFGTAAALAGVSLAEFMRILKQHGQDTVVVDWGDLDQELVRAGVIDTPLHDDAG